MCQAILFDMDGTLVDSTALVEELWGRWCRQRGLDVRELLSYSHGRRTAETMRRALPHLDAAEIEADARRMLDEELVRTDGIRAVPGAAAALAPLDPGRWAMVTAAPRALAEVRLKAAGLPLPAVLVGAESVSRGKPSPEGYLLAAAALGFPPDSCVVVEDSPAGVEAGHAAGMRVLALRTTHPDLNVTGAVAVPDLSYINVAQDDGHLRLRLR